MTTSAFDLWGSNNIQYLNAWNYKGEWDIRFVTNVVIAWNIRRTYDLKFPVADSDLISNFLFVTRRYVWISSLMTIGCIRGIARDDSEQHIKTSIGNISVNSYIFFSFRNAQGFPFISDTPAIEGNRLPSALFSLFLLPIHVSTIGSAVHISICRLFHCRYF